MTELMRWQSLSFGKSLRYPWRSEGWFWRMLPIALWQLIPFIGQIILIGYGLAVVRATCRQQTDLPKLQLQQSLIDGLRLVLVGVLYCFPIILMVLLLFTTSNSTEAKTTGGIPPIAFTAVMFIYLRISGEIAKRRPALKPTFSIVNRIVTAAFIAFVVVRLNGLFTTLRGGLQLSALQIDSSTIAMLLLALLLSAVIVVVLLVSATLFAATGSSLLKPTVTLQWMAANRSLSAQLIITVWLLALGTLSATMVGAMLLLIPGLLFMVAGNASIWFLTTQYAIKTGAVNME
ncbi:MAG: DUF4013 domain-containing protein [Phormidesmis sp.]